MGWKQITKSNELIILEKNLKNYKIKIEARKNNEIWEIFKTKIEGDKSTLISEYKVKDKELKEYLKKIKKSKPEFEPEFDNNTLKIKPENLILILKRVFKEEFSEKWEFKIENDDKNFIILNFANELEADIVLNKKYKPYENQIIRQLRNNLGFENLASNIYIKLYYFDETNHYSEENEDFFSFDSDYE